jgi:hypothetical protein
MWRVHSYQTVNVDVRIGIGIGIESIDTDGVRLHTDKVFKRSMSGLSLSEKREKKIHTHQHTLYNAHVMRLAV